MKIIYIKCEMSDLKTEQGIGEPLFSWFAPN